MRASPAWVAAALHNQDSGQPPLYNPVTDLCRRLSSVHGRVGAFGLNGQCDWYFWILARDGAMVRRFVWKGGVLLDEGEAIPAEVASRRDFENSRYGKPSKDPDHSFRSVWSEHTVNAVAADWTLPAAEVKAVLEREPGWLVLTPQGRKAKRRNTL
jgi:hypothetical protein